MSRPDLARSVGKLMLIAGTALLAWRMCRAKLRAQRPIEQGEQPAAAAEWFPGCEVPVVYWEESGPLTEAQVAWLEARSSPARDGDRRPADGRWWEPRRPAARSGAGC